jgi:thiamine biosynthesis lipoprotein
VTAVDVSFACMGTTVRIVAGDPGRVAAARAFLTGFDHRLSRFRPDSELPALNADPREEVPASALLRAAVHAGLWAATTTGGLVDPTVVDALEQAGYDRSLSGAVSQPLGTLLAQAPARRPAAPNPRSRWREVEVDDARGLIRRPHGTRLDTGGTGKGLAADAVAHRLDGEERFVVDCGGDVRVGGLGAEREPFEVSVVHPLTGRVEETFPLVAGGVATSGIDRRVWRSGGGRPAHHLIDPSTGRPAWTGLVGATAIAPSALEADVRAKAAVLSGPQRARELLRPHGGILFHEGGRSERVGLAIPRSALRRFAVVG